MKIFISCDIEGTCGCTDWHETEMGNAEYDRQVSEMQAEVAAACRGALAGGATEIYVKDSHDDARNIWFTDLPEQVHLIRGWLATPYTMVGGIDGSFDGCLYIGYHSPGGEDTSPLAHTMSYSRLFWIKLNGRILSEFDMHALGCAHLGVPSLFLSGDEGICTRSAELISGLKTVVTKSCVGGGTINRHPAAVQREIEEGVREAVAARAAALPEGSAELKLEICFKSHEKATKASWYPGAELVEPHVVRYYAKDYEDMLIAIQFLRSV